jgi:hypothetical protein
LYRAELEYFRNRQDRRELPEETGHFYQPEEPQPHVNFREAVVVRDDDVISIKPTHVTVRERTPEPKEYVRRLDELLRRQGIEFSTSYPAGHGYSTY